ncbi:MAG TPA: hypothetical protein ENI20_06450 [Bacteroides sp.]|nr:hypothetical protein [Bacteroides sp.]
MKILIPSRNLWIALAILSLFSMGLSAQDAGKNPIDSEAFRNPPNEYRISQYGLTPATLKKYPEYGIGGTFAFFFSILYPESGRENFKLGKKGPEVIGELVDSARAIDYKVWLADDWGYPSGSAGGMVVAENPDFEVRGLTMLTLSGQGMEPIEFSLPEDLHDIVYAAIYPRTEPGLDRLTGEVTESRVDLQSGKPVEANDRRISIQGLNGRWQLRVFARYVRDKDTQAQSTMRQFGHAGRYPDLMNQEAMASFLAHMHEPILARIEDPANSVEGFYTNEPNLMQTHWKWEPDAPYACAPWSEELPAQFKKMHGYDLFSILPFLFEGDNVEARRARIHYRQAVSELLTNSFSRQIREWCNARGIKSSGHFLLNDYLSMHVQGYGDMMKFVSEFDVPALDIPIPNPDEFKSFSYQQARFFSSVSAWKEQDMTLMLLDPIIGGYGKTRLSPDLPLLINAVNMASFHGVNMFTSYLPLDANKGRDANGRSTAARGYTPEEFRFLNEYTGRLTQVMRGARRDAGVGLYYPIAMFQADLLASDRFWPFILSENRERQAAWDHTEKSLLEGDVEYMIVHPEAVAEASIENGHMKIGYGSYHTLVMPQLEYIPLEVAEQLRRFEQSGGKILWIGQVPRHAEHAGNDQAVNVALKYAQAISVEEIAESIEKSYSPEFDLTFTPGTDKLTVGRFHQEAEQVYLLVNREQEEIVVEAQGQRIDGGNGKVRILDPSTGEISSLSLPARIPLEANRSLILMPGQEYLKQSLLNK